MSDCIQLKNVPISGQSGPLHFCSVVMAVRVCCCSFTQQWVVSLMVLGCLLPCANPAWGRQLKGHIQALWIAPITANGTSPYLHTSIHLSSARTLGSRSSEPGLPPLYTADCKDHFLQETKSSIITIMPGFHTAKPPGQSFTHNILNSSSLCCFSAVPVIHCHVVLLPEALMDPAFTPLQWSSLPAGRTLSWAIAFNTTKSILSI